MSCRTLDENKTDDPRAWALGADVSRALRRWKELAAPNAEASSHVFAYRGEHVGVEHPADTLRGHLGRVEGIRPKLLEDGPNRRRLRAHDLRATSVTLALANGKTETWVADRTGHKSSNMINRYRRAARTVAELSLGWLAPLDEAIPELRRTVYGSSTGGSSSGEPARAQPVNHRHSRPLATAGDGENAFRFRRRKAWEVQAPPRALASLVPDECVGPSARLRLARRAQVPPRAPSGERGAFRRARDCSGIGVVRSFDPERWKSLIQSQSERSLVSAPS